jgi:hypothetical protein
MRTQQHNRPADIAERKPWKQLPTETSKAFALCSVCFVGTGVGMIQLVAPLGLE